MQVSYQLTAEDFRQGILSHYSGRVILRTALTWAVLIVAAETLIWATNQDRPIVSDILPLSIFAVFLVAFFWLCPYYSARKQFSGSPSAKLLITLEASEDVLQFKTEDSNSSTSWLTYIKWRERQTVFVLFASPVVFYVVPKRGFTATQVDEFRDMLKRNIPNEK